MVSGALSRNRSNRRKYKHSKKNGICIRCSKPSIIESIFCSYHKELNKESTRRCKEKKKWKIVKTTNAVSSFNKRL